jgi:hypothetical protein
MRSLLVGLFLVVATAVAHAQSVGLPKVDSVNFFGEVGDFESREATSLNKLPVYGWGFETTFTVSSTDTHIVELAIGYDQFFEHADLKASGYLLDGNMRDLPSISVYFTFRHNVYVGLSTGVVSLAGATVSNPSNRFTVTGDTFDAAGKLGYAIPFQPGQPLAKQRVYGFVEADYHARYFGALNYSAGAPADLPTRIYLGGVTLAIGIQVCIDPVAAKPKATK